MKNKITTPLFLLAIAMIVGTVSSNAQTVIQHPDGSYFKQCSSFSISKSIKELSELEAAKGIEKGKDMEAADAENERGRLPLPGPNALPKGEDPARQTSDGSRILGAPLVNFAGITDSYIPCDPSGASGPNHFVQAVNCRYRVYNKTGTALTSSITMASLWPAGGSSKSDPCVLYDKFADRWLITMLDVTNKAILMAVSTTADPTGTYYLYSFVPMSGILVDYPKFSIWPDGYYQVGNTSTEKVAIYERTKMLTGDNTAGMIVSTITGMVRTSAFFCPVALDADGQLPPYGAPNYIMSYQDDGWGASYKDQLDIFKVTANWSSKTATVVKDASLTVPAFKGVLTSGRNDIAQSGGAFLDGLDGLLMYRAPYRIWAGYNSVVLSHVVDAGSGVAGIRWYELRQDTATKAWSIYQQSTYAPADGINRFMPSIAQDNAGSIGLCYAACSATVPACLRYTGRLAGDALGQMTFTEQIAVAGSGAQTSSQRFGDYSHTSVDADGYTFWHTAQYLVSGSRATRIYSFQLATNPTGTHELPNQGEFTIYQNENMLIVVANKLAASDKVLVDLFDISGKLIKRNNVSPVSNMLETKIDVSGLTKGAYLVRIGNNSFQKVVKVLVN